MPRRLLYLLLSFQALSHLFWLSPAAHSGQVAIPWMMNRGLTLFGDIWEQHAPGSSLLAAAAQSLIGIDPGLLVKLLNIGLVLALTMLVYLLTKQLAGAGWGGLLAAAVFAWWAPVYGNVLLYFETLLALCVCAALLVYLRAGERRSRGDRRGRVVDGRRTLFKQHAWLPSACSVYAVLIERRRQEALFTLARANPAAAAMDRGVERRSAEATFLELDFNLAAGRTRPLVRSFRKLLLTNRSSSPLSSSPGAKIGNSSFWQRCGWRA